MQEMKLHFQRFEFKYWLSFQQLQEIRRQLRRYVDLDGFARDAASGFYEVVSLYYDSPKFYYYNQKNDGVKDRKKIRLRTYRVDGAFVDYAFFEIKRKSDSVILKDRFWLDMNAYGNFLRDNSFPSTSSENGKNTGQVIKEYDAERCRRALQPQIKVGYCREPYLGKFNKNFRVTFDYNIKACESRELFEDECRVPVLEDGIIMEVKFNGRLPHYIREIIDRYNLERISYSKYGRAAETCYLLSDFNFSRNYFFSADKNLLTQY